MATADVYEDLRPLAFSIAYRMLGSVSEAEDVVQEAFLRLHRAAREGTPIESEKAYLTTVTTRLAIDQLRSARARREAYVGSWLPEPLLADSAPDAAGQAEAADSISLAFLVLLERLNPVERAVLILREVLRWRAEEVGELLGTSVASVNSALQRARATMASRQADGGSAAKPLDEASRALLDRYVDAFERYDMKSLTALLHQDATWNMPPYDLWLATHRDIVGWCLGQGIGCRDSRLVPTMANGQPAFGQYKPSPDGGREAWSLQVLELSGDRIAGITFFLDTARFFPLFGLPLRLED
jgi:RNA polymerase sigma-70 factor (ECF subfamily)